MSTKGLQLALDRVSLGLAAACALHCALTPIALVAFPVLAATTLGDEGFHRMMLGLILPSSGLAFTLGCRRHKDVAVLAVGTTGLVLLVALALGGHAVLGEVGERLLTVLAAAALAISHVRNYLLCRREACERCAEN